MGQKVNPHGLRVGVNKEWSSSWIANKKEFSNYLVEDNKIRKLSSIRKPHPLMPMKVRNNAILLGKTVSSTCPPSEKMFSQLLV